MYEKLATLILAGMLLLGGGILVAKGGWCAAGGVFLMIWGNNAAEYTKKRTGEYNNAKH
ncbi:MAG: hypothetical protein GY794_16075 [bacterium]|nr:hypothetical protein [bacterium]